MSFDINLIRKIHLMNREAHENARLYFHSSPMAVSESSIVLPGKKKFNFKICYDIKDLFVIGANTHSSLLMTGGTDTGKTTLAKLMMNSLFGEEDKGWHRIDVNTDFGKDVYTDVDFGVIADGKKMSEGFYRAAPYLSLPGLIADEMNRGLAKMVNILLHVFEKDISMPDGTRAKIGVKVNGDNGENYQFQVAAINEGDEYAGTFEIDKALRRRTIMEIPMDLLSLTPYDRYLIKSQGQRHIPLINNNSHLEDILDIYRHIKDIPVHPAAEMFIAYLEAFDFCKNSLSGEKGGVTKRAGSVRHICAQPVGGMASRDDSEFESVMSSENNGYPAAGCEFLKAFSNELCPYITGLTPGISENLLIVARGFALLRGTKFAEMAAGFLEDKPEIPLSYSIPDFSLFQKALSQYAGTDSSKEDIAKKSAEKYFSNLEVEVEDIESALGFVAYSKIGISHPWVIKHYQGNKLEAIKNFSKEAKLKFMEGIAREDFADMDRLLRGELSGEEIREMEHYCARENPWLMRVILPYIQQRKMPEQASMEKMEKFYR